MGIGHAPDPQDSPRVDIVLAGDRRALLGLAVAVRSALEHAAAVVNVHVIAVGLLEAEKEKLRHSWEHPNCGLVRFAEVDPSRLRPFRSTGYLKSKTAYARYFIPELFPDLERCIYLDADLLVFRDLAEAWRMDLGGRLAAAVRDISVRVKDPDLPLDTDVAERLGLREPRNYFNSGFLVMDLDAWRREGTAAKLAGISIARFDDLHAQDQDALNAILEDRVLLLDADWNRSQYEKPAPLDGHVVHLLGPVKPWHARYKAKFRDSYYKDAIFATCMQVLDRTEFRNWRPWDVCGLGRLREYIDHKTPTGDMIVGKLRRMWARGRRRMARSL